MVAALTEILVDEHQVRRLGRSRLRLASSESSLGILAFMIRGMTSELWATAAKRLNLPLSPGCDLGWAILCHRLCDRGPPSFRCRVTPGIRHHHHWRLALTR